MQKEYEQAKELIRKDEIEPALEILRRLEKTEASAELLNDIGVCLYLLRDFESALEYFERSLAKSPDFSLAKINKFYIERAWELLRNSDLRYRQIHHDGLIPKEPAPKISVIVRTYNRPDLLREALLSLKNQTFKDFETIVINDGGAKEALEVAKEVNPPNLRYYYAPHKGPASALNRGLEMARGKYIAFLDDDDVFYPEHLELLLSRLERENQPALCYPNAKIAYYDEKGNLKKSEVYRKEKIELWELVRKDLIIAMMVLVSRECFEQEGLFIEELITTAHDWEMWIRLRKKYPFFHLDQLTCEYRERIKLDRCTQKPPFDIYYYSNLMLYMHKVIKLFSFPLKAGLEGTYKKLIKTLNKLLKTYPEIERQIRIYGIYHSDNPAGYLYDRYRILREYNEKTIAEAFLKAYIKLKPFEPKGWFNLLALKLKR